MQVLFSTFANFHANRIDGGTEGGNEAKCMWGLGRLCLLRREPPIATEDNWSDSCLHQDN